MLVERRGSFLGKEMGRVRGWCDEAVVRGSREGWAGWGRPVGGLRGFFLGFTGRFPGVCGGVRGMGRGILVGGREVCVVGSNIDGYLVRREIEMLWDGDC